MRLTWFRRFRTKLVLTLFPILAGVTVASIWVAERRFSVMHQRLFEAQFQAHIEAFDAARERRFEAISSRLEEIADNPALFEFLRSGSEDGLRRVVEPLLQELGRQRLSSEQMVGGGMAARGGFRFGGLGELPRGGRASGERRGRPEQDALMPPSLAGEPRPPPPITVMLLDKEGRVVTRMASSGERPEARGASSEGAHHRYASFLRAGGRSFAELLKGQEVGYALIEQPEEQRRQVREVFVTPIHDENGGFMGALVFGLPLPSLDERVLFRESERLEGGQIMSGVWVDGHLVSSTIPETSQKELLSLMDREMAEENGARGDLTLTVNGQRHRVIYRKLNPDSPFARAAQVNLYSLAPLDKEIAELRVIAAEIAGVAMVAALGLILFVSRGLSGPVSLLTEATREIAAGRFGMRVPVRTRDEIGLLGEAFNAMSAELALRERYRSVLNAVADPAVASRLLHEDAELGGLQKEVSVLFCDIRGFTALSERLPAHEVVDLLNHHMTAMTEVAYEYGGTVDKFVGDMVMVLFGAPESAGDDALRAVRCALAMRRARARLNQGGTLPLEIGIGITTGQMIVGCMGSEKRLSYTVIGHRVNLAARLCALAGTGQIVIDEGTRAALPGTIQTTPLQPARLKGISDAVPCFAVLGEIDE